MTQEVEEVEDHPLEEIQRLVELQDIRLAKDLGKGMYLPFLPPLLPSMIDEACYFRQNMCKPFVGM
jgi:hypothetical protein